MVKVNVSHVSNPRDKFKPNWAGPYTIKRILSGGATYIMDLDGMDFASPVNIDKLKRYYLRDARWVENYNGGQHQAKFRAAR